MPRVSIGLPVYNGGQFLEGAIGSLLVQTYEDFELIISDNASTDQTESVCRAYAAQDGRVRYHRNAKNIGANRNYNRVFALSNGEFFRWAAADDVCKPEHLAQCVGVLEDDPEAVLACTKTQFIDVDGLPIDVEDAGWDLRLDAPSERLRYVIRAGHWCNVMFGLMRSRALAQTHLLPGYAGGDYVLLGELALLGKFHETPECLFLRRLHPGASSQNSDPAWLSMFFNGRSEQVSLPLLNRYADHLSTVLGSKLGLGAKAALIGCILHCAWWKHSILLREVKAAAPVGLHRYFSSRGQLAR